MPTNADREGEQPWPTQPIPFTASGKMMAPVSPVTATDIAPNRLPAWAAVPMFTPPGRGRIQTPGQGGGANYGPLAYSPRTGYLYVNAIDDPNNAGRPAKGYFSAYNPTTGDTRVAEELRRLRAGRACTFTASDLVFVGSGSNIAGYFMAFDAKSGEMLWKLQHRCRRVFVAFDVHGQRRTVRHRRIGRGRWRTVAAT